MSSEKWTIVVLHDHPKWFSIIQDAIKGYDVNVEEWISDEVEIDLTSPPPRCSPTAHTRGHPLSLDQARVVVKWLELHKAPVVNGLLAIEVEDSKAYQYVIAQSVGLKVPKTLFTSTPSKELIHQHFGPDTPFVIKPDRGGHGMDIKMFHTLDEFSCNEEPPVSYTGLFVIQEFIPSSALYRAEFVDKKFQYVSKALMCDGFSSNFCPDDLSKDRFQILTQLDDPVIAKCEKLFQMPGLDNGAVEFLFAPDGDPYVIDINCNTVYNTTAEVEAGLKPGWEVVAQALYDDVQLASNCGQ